MGSEMCIRDSFYGIPYEELRRYWLAGKVYSLVEEEEDANGILYMVAEEMEKYGNHPTKLKNKYGKN